MPKIRLIILVVISLVAVGFAYVAVKKENYVADTFQSNNVFLDGLKENLPKVESIAIVKKGNWIKISKSGDAWVLADRYGYVVDNQKINKLLVGAANLKKVEKKTSDESRYETIAVDDASGEESRASRIILADKNGEQVFADFIQGDEKRSGNYENSNQLYVRKTSENAAYLVSGDFDITLGSDYFIEPEILKIAQKRIHEVTIKHPSYEAKIDDLENAVDDNVKIYRAVGVEDFTLSSDQKIKSKVLLNEIADILENRITFMDVAPVDAVELLQDDAVNVTFKTFDQLEVLVQVWKTQNGNWARFSSLSGKPQNKESENINAAVDGWIYKISDKSTEGLTQKLSDLVAKPE